jgi:S1-C subfamily serine protease
MRLTLIFTLFIMSSHFVAADDFVANHEINSVVKIFTVHSQPDYYQPWQNLGQQSSTGSGFVISGNRILTNAHNVANQTFVMVRKQGDPKRYEARLEYAGHDCDLAILKVNDQDFFKSLPPMEFGDMPKIQNKVAAIGYPTGGDNISITEGVVSRIEPVIYYHSGRPLLAIQIDAAINPGNSGGPVMDNQNKVVGVAFQGITNAQNIGYIIPLPVIKHFLKDIEDGKFDGFPDCPFESMRMENPDMRKWIGMNSEQSGVMIKHISPMFKKKNILKIKDVIMAIDGIKVANDGTVPFRQQEVIFFGSLIWEKFPGDKCRFTILRDGKVMDVEYALEREEQLVPPRTFDKLPSYYIIGGLVIVPLSTNYLDCWGDLAKSPRELLNYLMDGEITDCQNQVVVVSAVLADKVNVGYQDFAAQAVIAVNGIKPKNLKHFISIIEKMTDGFMEIDLENKDKIVLQINAARTASMEILERYRIPADRSSDLSGTPLPKLPSIGPVIQQQY